MHPVRLDDLDLVRPASASAPRSAHGRRFVTDPATSSRVQESNIIPGSVAGEHPRGSRIAASGKVAVLLSVENWCCRRVRSGVERNLRGNQVGGDDDVGKLLYVSAPGP